MARPDGPGSQALPEAPSDLRPSGVDPSRGPLLAKAREQFAYWQERVRRQKSFDECWNEDGSEYTPLGDDDAYQFGYCHGRWAEAEWWLKTIEALPAPTHEHIVAEMVGRIQKAHDELCSVFPPRDAR